MNNTTTTASSCIRITWSPATFAGLIPTLYICSFAVVIHTIFWIQFLFYPSVRQKGMMWIYVYLLTDLFLLFRFYLFYGQRISNVCIPIFARTILCYFEAASKLYTSIIQSYVLLALNICRYVQIVFNRNAYVKNIRLIISAHLAIYIFPFINIAFQFLINWTQLWRTSGGLCDIRFMSVYVQIYNLIVAYAIPVFLNLIFLSLCIRFISSTGDIRNEQILKNRRKFHRSLLIQSILFYSIWLVLWSPYILAFPFVNINSVTGSSTSLLNYVQVAIDPAIVAVIDVRFLKAWRATYRRIKQLRQRQIDPSLTTIVMKKY
jgi:hypothetical protein